MSFCSISIYISVECFHTCITWYKQLHQYCYQIIKLHANTLYFSWVFSHLYHIIQTTAWILLSMNKIITQLFIAKYVKHAKWPLTYSYLRACFVYYSYQFTAANFHVQLLQSNMCVAFRLAAMDNRNPSKLISFLEEPHQQSQQKKLHG